MSCKNALNQSYASHAVCGWVYLPSPNPCWETAQRQKEKIHHSLTREVKSTQVGKASQRYWPTVCVCNFHPSNLISSHLLTRLIFPLAPSSRRRSIRALTLALSSLSIMANEVCIRRSAGLRRRRGRLEHLGLSRRVLVLGVFGFVFVAVHTVAVAVATARSATFVLFFLSAGFGCGGC
jgi:hypothetical protein